MQNAITLTLLFILTLAVFTDMHAHRIPNTLTGAGVLAGLLLQFLAGGAPALLGSTLGIAAGIAILLPFYLLRGMAAGDVKLMGAVGSFIGAKAVLLAGCTTLIIGAVLGLAIFTGHLLNRSGFGPKQALLNQPAEQPATPAVRKEKFPYAIPIAGGSLVALSQLGHLNALAGFILGWSST